MKYKLKDICTKITDGSHNPPSGIQYSQYLMLSSKNIADDSITFDNPRYLTEDDFITENKRTNIQLGDLLLTIVGTVGRVAVVSATTSQICLQRSVAVLKPRQDIVNSRYLMYHLQYIRPTLEAEAKGVAQKGIYLKQVENIEVSIPAITTQIEIINTLDTVSDLLALRKQQLSELDELVKSRFVELFGNIDECENKLELQDICLKITDGSHNPPSGVEKSQNYMISSQNIHDNIIDYKDVRYLSDSDFENENKRTAIMPGDVLLTIVGAIGRSAVVKDDLNITCQRSVCVIHPNRDKVNSIFLKYMLDSISDKIINEARGAAQKGIYLNQVKKLQIICPSSDFQNQFATFVEQTDKSRLAVQNSIAELEELKKSLMQKYFG